MESMLYPGSLVIVALMAFTFFKSHNTILMAIALLIGVYIVYSHETGNTATGFKNEMVDSINEEAEDFSQRRGTGGFDAQKIADTVK